MVEPEKQEEVVEGRPPTREPEPQDFELVYNQDHTTVAVKKGTPGKGDDKSADEEMQVTDELSVKGIPWSILKFKLADESFDALAFAVSLQLSYLITVFVISLGIPEQRRNRASQAASRSVGRLR